MPPAEEKASNELIKELIVSFNMSAFANTNDFEKLKTKETIINFIKILNRRKVDIAMLRSLSFRGIPNEIKGLRPLVWKVLLGYLPRETSKWEDEMRENKKTYDYYMETIIVIPDMENEEKNNKNFVNDHPLSVNQKSLWNQYFIDNTIWQEIEKDIRRTRTDMQFFTDAYDPKERHNIEQLKKQASYRKSDLKGYFKRNYIFTHADVMSRILFIYARLNPTVVYVQGMNEVLATLYYCFWNSTVSHAEYFESDLFFTFTVVMSDLRDGFVRYMDSEETGINGKIAKFSTMLKEIDPDLYTHLHINNV